MNLSNEIIISSHGGSSGHMTVWDLNSKNPLMQMRDDEKTTFGTLCSVRQEYVYVGVQGKPLLYRWALTNGQRSKLLKTQTVPGHISSLGISADASLLAAAMEEKIFLWQLNSGDLLAVLSDPGMQTINQIEFLDPPSFLVTASDNGMIAVWNLGAVRSLYSGISQPTIDPVFSVSPCASAIRFTLIDIISDTLIVVVGEDGQFAVYSLMTGRQLEDTDFPSPCFSRPLFCVVSTAMGSLVVCGSTNGIIASTSLSKRHPSYMRLKEHRILKETSEDETAGDVARLCLSPSGQSLVCGTRCGHVVLVGLPDLVPYHRLHLDGPVTNLTALWRPPWIDNFDAFQPSACLTHPLRREAGLLSNFSILPGCREAQSERKGRFTWLPSFYAAKQPRTTEETTEESEEVEDKVVSEVQRLRTEGERLREVNRNLHQRLLASIVSEPTAMKANVSKSAAETVMVNELTADNAKVSEPTAKKAKVSERTAKRAKVSEPPTKAKKKAKKK